MPTQWFMASNNAPTYDIAASVHDVEPPQKNNKPLYDYVKPVVAPKDADAEMKWKLINGKVRTGIADAGASASCGQPELSDCGGFRIDSDLFNLTGRKSGKVFQYAGVSIAAANDANQFKFNMRDVAKEVHMVPGINNTLVSTNQFAKSNYAWIFDKDMVNIYDMNNTEIKVSISAVLKGWRVPKEGLWRIPLE